MKFIYIYISCLLAASCLQQKEIVRPDMELHVYDKQSKKAIQDVKVSFKRNSGIALPAEKDILSDPSGKIKIPQLKIMLGNHPKLPLLDSSMVLTKEQYNPYPINYVHYFKINSESDRNKTYVSDSIFLEKSTK